MAAPMFTLVAGDGLASRIGSTREALAGAQLTLKPNIKKGDTVVIDDGLETIENVILFLDEDGKINGDTGVELLADDVSLALANPLQWQINIRGAKAQGYTRVVSSWWIDAGVDDSTVSLENEPKAVGQTAYGLGTAGAALIRVAAEAALGAFLASSAIGFVDEGNGEGHFTVAGIPISGTLVPPAAVLSGIATSGEDGQDISIDSGGLVAKNPLYIDPTQAPYFVKADRKTFTTASMSSVTNPTHLTVTLAFTANTTNGSPTLSSVSSFSDITVGAPLSGVGIPGGAVVQSMNVGAGTVTMSANATVTDSDGMTVFANYMFTSADIGKHAKVIGAAAAAANLKTTIVGVSSGKAVLDDACSTTVANVFCIFGTDNHDALQAFCDDISHTGASLGRTAVFGEGTIMFSGTVYLPYAASVKGASENWEGQDVFWGRSLASETRQSTCFYQMWDSNADAFRVQQALPNQANWVGKLEGFVIVSDLDNTAGSGLSFRNSDGDPVSVIDGASIQRINVSGAPGPGFDFAGGVVGNAVFRDLAAWGCGYMDRKVFTADTTNGSTTLSNVSSFTGLKVGGVLSGPGIAVDSVILSMNSGAGTLVVRYAATATAAGVSVQQAGSAGVRYYLYGAETVHFDMLSGDQNSLATLEIVGSVNTGGPSAIVVTSIKNEFTVNAYRESYNDVATYPSVPQGANMIVTDYATNARITIRGFSHWAGATSSVGGPTPNPMGRHLGAAILDVGTSGVVGPDITWEGGLIRLAAGSGQADLVVMRDVHSANMLALTATKGSNRVAPRTIRAVADASVVLSAHDSVIAYNSITAARVVTLPPSTVIPQGRELLIADWSGSASTTITITASPGADTIVGDTAVNHPYGQLSLIWNGTAWVGRATRAPNLSATATLDFPTVIAASHADLTMTVTGAVVGDIVTLDAPPLGGIFYTASVTSTNTVTVRARNYTAGNINPASGTFKAVIVR
jgi:hypothetical protein